MMKWAKTRAWIKMKFTMQNDSYMGFFGFKSSIILHWSDCRVNVLFHNAHGYYKFLTFRLIISMKSLNSKTIYQNITVFGKVRRTRHQYPYKEWNSTNSGWMTIMEAYFTKNQTIEIVGEWRSRKHTNGWWVTVMTTYIPLQQIEQYKEGASDNHRNVALQTIKQ
jgi:hypothetical protein